MREDYDHLVANALKAVRQLHADTSRLFQDCDGKIGTGKESRFGNGVTHGISGHLRADYWMAHTVYRYYYDPRGTDGLADAVSACFFDEKELITVPFLLVGQIKYKVDANAEIATKCEGWDLRKAYFEWGTDRKPDIAYSGRRADDRVEWFRVIGVRLYSIESLGQVEALMGKVKLAALANEQ